MGAWLLVWVFLPATAGADDAPLFFRYGKMDYGSQIMDWGGGLSICDPVRASKREFGPEASGEHAYDTGIRNVLDKVLDLGRQLEALQCRPEMVLAAKEIDGELKLFSERYLPGVLAINCRTPGKSETERRLMLDETVATGKAGEGLFERILRREDAAYKSLKAAVPDLDQASGCDLKARIGWAAFRMSTNDVSCEILFSQRYLEKAQASEPGSRQLTCNEGRVQDEAAAVAKKADTEAGPPEKADESDITGVGTH